MFLMGAPRFRNSSEGGGHSDFVNFLRRVPIFCQILIIKTTEIAQIKPQNTLGRNKQINVHICSVVLKHLKKPPPSSNVFWMRVTDGRFSTSESLG